MKTNIPQTSKDAAVAARVQSDVYGTNLARKGTIVSIKQIAKRTIQAAIKVAEDFNFIAGQYIWLQIPELTYPDPKGNTRMFSIASSPNKKGELDIIFRTSESGYKKTLVEMMPGTDVIFSGPYGPMALPKNNLLPVMLVAGGVGVAPFLSMIRFSHETSSGHEIALVYANSSKEEAVCIDELSKIEKKNPNFKLTTLFGLLDTEVFRQLSNGEAFWFVTGPKEFVDYVGNFLIKRRVPLRNMFFGQFYPSAPFKSKFEQKLESVDPDSRAADYPYLLALDSVSNHVVITDINGIILYANHAAETMTGYTFAEMRGNTPRLWGALMPRYFYENLWKTIKYDRQTFSGEVKNRRKNQEEYYALMRVSPIIDKDGALTGFVVSEEDITYGKQREEYFQDMEIAAMNVLDDSEVDRKRLVEANAKQNALAKDLEKFKLAVDNVTSSVLITDREGIVLYANDALEKITGYRPEEMMGQKSDILWKTSMPVEHYQKLWDIIKNQKKVFSGEIQNKRKNGEVYTAVITISPILDEKGEVEFFVSIERDITKEKETEKVRMDFLTLASHQLRTPLSGTKWLIGTLKRKILGPVTEKQGEYLDELYQINERMITLVFEMLSVLRLESESALIKKETISIRDLYEEVSLMMASAAQSKGVKLVSGLEDRTMIVLKSDAQMLRLIIDTFISNAINYSQTGQEIHVDVKEETSDVVFSVSDSGIGIPKEEQKQVFERFYRASNAKLFKPDGTGLGLYVAVILAEKIGGKISFESEVGKGTTFYLRIPK